MQPQIPNGVELFEKNEPPETTLADHARDKSAIGMTLFAVSAVAGFLTVCLISFAMVPIAAVTLLLAIGAGIGARLVRSGEEKIVDLEERQR